MTRRRAFSTILAVKSKIGFMAMIAQVVLLWLKKTSAIFLLSEIRLRISAALITEAGVVVAVVVAVAAVAAVVGRAPVVGMVAVKIFPLGHRVKVPISFKIGESICLGR